MWPPGFVIELPVFNDPPGICQGGDPVFVQAFIPELAPLKLSTKAFRADFPGSMKCAVSTGPFAQRSGCTVGWYGSLLCYQGPLEVIGIFGNWGVHLRSFRERPDAYRNTGRSYTG